jgi:MoxR-like ATPase
VLLLHGGGQTRHSWARTAKRLQETGRTAFTVDLRGHGDSDWDPAEDYTLDAFVADGLELVRSFESPPVLVGASLGGITALQIAGLHPGLVSGLVLVDIVVEVREQGVDRIRRFMTANPDGFGSLEEVADAIAAYNPLRPRPANLDGLRKNLRQGEDGRWRWHWDPAFMGIGDEPQRRVEPEVLGVAAARLDVPTLLVHGKRSDLVSEAGIADMRRRVPQADVVDVPAAGHMVAGDDNDVFTASLETFLEKADRFAARDSIRAEVVGRERELELILAAVGTGRDLLLEGPPGTSKTTLLKAITAAWGIPLILAEGNAELTPGRLLGHHDPARVLQEGYSEETFEPGPLVEAMRRGGFLYFEEFNRAPEDTLNTLLTAIADRQVTIPRMGTVEALPSFRLVGSMNPFDNVGTTRLSVSIKDRLNRLLISYQDAAAEEEIVRRRAGEGIGSQFGPRIVADAVAVTRATRSHDTVAQGASVRGAIDLALMAAALCTVRRTEPADEEGYREAFWETMVVALSGRISLDHAAGVDELTVLREIWEHHFVLADRLAEPGRNVVELPPQAPLQRQSDTSDRANRPFKAKPKELDGDPEVASGSNGAGLAVAAERDPSRKPDRRPGATGFSDEEGQVDDEEGEQTGPNRAVRARAREIAARLALRDPARRRRPRRGGQEILSLPYSAGGEVDLDRTLDLLTERRALRSEEVSVRERRRTRREIVLAVDVSGSMRGERLLTAAATVGALSASLHRDDLAVIAFWSDAAALLRLGERAPLEQLVDEILGLEAAGLTNLSFPLQLAAEELGGAGGAEQRVLLLSDCVHNAGPDPRGPAGRLQRLDVLFDVGGERDSDLATGLARSGHGAVAPIRGHRDIAPALGRLLGTN